jgi:hypothetical protein
MKVSSLKQPLKGSKFLTETIRNIFSPFFSHTPRRVQIRARKVQTKLEAVERYMEKTLPENSSGGNLRG